MGALTPTAVYSGCTQTLTVTWRAGGRQRFGCCRAASPQSSLKLKPVCGLKDSAPYVHFNTQCWCPKHYFLLKMGSYAIQKASFAAQSHFCQLSHQWRGWKIKTFLIGGWQLMAALTFTRSKFCPLEHLCHSNAFHTVPWHQLRARFGPRGLDDNGNLH